MRQFLAPSYPHAIEHDMKDAVICLISMQILLKPFLKRKVDLDFFLAKTMKFQSNQKLHITWRTEFWYMCLKRKIKMLIFKKQYALYS